MPLPVVNLKPGFHAPTHYRADPSKPYELLPFRFIRLDDQRYVVTNLVGEYIVLPRLEVEQLVRRRVPIHSRLYDELKARHIVFDEESTVGLDLLAVKYRTKQALLAELTSLFMFVVTLRCEHSCPYCQVSRVSDDRAAFDMTPEAASAGVSFLFRSPSRRIKIEFQGGEPLLNFEIVRAVVEHAEEQNRIHGRELAFVVATNLALLDDVHLEFFKEHGVFISTSLDGPAELHDANRPRPGRDAHARTVDGIRRVREALGPDAVSALMTSTTASLARPRDIIDEYCRLGLNSIFLRPISPYGFATKSRAVSAYEVEEWLAFYREALDYIIELNLTGTFLREVHSALYLEKMLSPFPTGYVDLQSPAGIGIAGMVINYDGSIYASDESRMLAEMDDRAFRLGHVLENSFEEILASPALLEPLMSSMAEAVPMCSDCAFLPYCGSDPVFHHATQADPIGFKPTSGFCRRSMGIVRHLIAILEDDPERAAVLRSWIRC